MGSFGEDLRMERMSRGIALEHITAITKISQHHLLALEQERFRQLPGGILNKGIVRGYAGAIGLDQHDWTERFLQAYRASGLVIEDPNWTAFASNVGKARLQRREANEFRLRWLGALILLLLVAPGRVPDGALLRGARRLVADGASLQPCHSQGARRCMSLCAIGLPACWPERRDPSPTPQSCPERNTRLRFTWLSLRPNRPVVAIRCDFFRSGLRSNYHKAMHP